MHKGIWIQKPTYEIQCVIEVCEGSVCVSVWPSMPTDAVTSAPVSFMLLIPLYLSAKNKHKQGHARVFTVWKKK